MIEHEPITIDWIDEQIAKLALNQGSEGKHAITKGDLLLARRSIESQQALDKIKDGFADYEQDALDDYPF